MGRPRYARGSACAAVLLATAVVFVPTAAAERPIASLTAWVAADLDGDRTADFVRAGAFRSDGPGFVQEISLHFSAVGSGTVFVRTPAIACRLVARDIDGDADRDLILETLFREPLAILLNDGGGHFHEGRVEDFRQLFSTPERRSWETAQRQSPDNLARDAYQDEASVDRVHAVFADLTSTGAVDNPSSFRSSSVLHNLSTRGPPAV